LCLSLLFLLLVSDPSKKLSSSEIPLFTPDTNLLTLAAGTGAAGLAAAAGAGAAAGLAAAAGAGAAAAAGATGFAWKKVVICAVNAFPFAILTLALA